MDHEKPASALPADVPWLLRIPEIFEGLADELLACFHADGHTRLGADYYLVKTRQPASIRHGEASPFLRWNLPLKHTWPCNARKMEGFIEKAAQALVRKFGPRQPQGIFIGQLNPSSPDKYYKGLASNLRGRALQLFPDLSANTVDDQDPQGETLFCLLGKEGLFAGMQSPRACNGFYPGGSKYIGHHTPDTISRAGAKIAEALHYLRLYRAPLAEGSRWIELGAAPGGMTSELLARKQNVTAIDRAPLDVRVQQNVLLTFIQADAAHFLPREDRPYDVILSDLNGPPEESMAHVTRLTSFLREKGLVIFTLKLPRVESLKEPCQRLHDIVAQAEKNGLHLFAQTHLTYNRHELTLFLERNAPRSMRTSPSI